MLDIAKTVWDVAKGLFDLRGMLDKARRERRDRLATYFDELAKLVDSVAASLRDNQYPHGSCAQLHTLALMMEETLKGLVPAPQAKAFQEQLMQVWQIEQLFAELQGQPDGGRRKLAMLDEAAGFFRATAMHLRTAI